MKNREEKHSTLQHYESLNNNALISPESLNYYPLKSRKLDKETTEKFNIGFFKYTGSFGSGNNLHWVNDQWTYVFSYYKNGILSKQKIRSVDNKKNMKILGNTSNGEFFGQNLFTPHTDRFVVIVEGEFDAAAVYQYTKFMCISVTCGASSALSDIKMNLEYLNKFKYVVLALDNDKAGNESLQKILENNPFEPGKLRIARWPQLKMPSGEFTKDPCDLVIVDKINELKMAIWNAEEYRPRDLYFPEDLIETALIKPKRGINTPWKNLTDSLMGWRFNTIVTLAAADGIGKTELADEILHSLVSNGNKVWLYSCEQEPEETLRRQAAKQMNLPLHIPGVNWDKASVRLEMEKLKGNLIMWRPEKALGPIEFLDRMKYASIAYGVKYFILDHLKGIESQMSDINHAMGKFLSDLKHFVKTHNAWVLLLAHVAKDKKQGKLGKDDESWNRGRVPTKENIYGSSAITAWSDVILGGSRNVESENSNTSRITRIDILKNRLMGNRGFKRVYLEYINDTGRLIQINNIDYEDKNDDNP